MASSEWSTRDGDWTLPLFGTASVCSDRVRYRGFVVSQLDDRSAIADLDATRASIPTFLIIGAQKSATRWLRQNLGRHPHIYTSPYEISFFNSPKRFKSLGMDWYRAQFDGWSGEAIVGEATPGYMMWRHDPEGVARRIRTTIPGARLIAILRNPVDRANSAMVHHIKHERLRPQSNLLTLVEATPPEDDRLGLVAGGWYAASLKPFQNAFGDRLLVLLHDDIRRDPRASYATALGHVGASPVFVPPELDELVYSNQEGDVTPWKRDVPSSDRDALYEYFRDDLRELERMIGRDLSIWEPAHS